MVKKEKNIWICSSPAKWKCLIVLVSKTKQNHAASEVQQVHEHQGWEVEDHPESRLSSSSGNYGSNSGWEPAAVRGGIVLVRPTTGKESGEEGSATEAR